MKKDNIIYILETTWCSRCKMYIFTPFVCAPDKEEQCPTLCSFRKSDQVKKDNLRDIISKEQKLLTSGDFKIDEALPTNS